MLKRLKGWFQFTDDKRFVIGAVLSCIPWGSIVSHAYHISTTAEWWLLGIQVFGLVAFLLPEAVARFLGLLKLLKLEKQMKQLEPKLDYALEHGGIDSNSELYQQFEQLKAKFASLQAGMRGEKDV
jgi:hypothetical protein